ncbi:MAG: sulfite exporter TauE/SafE family protein [Armatimonadetes bacterium]|nr:sulfite exporter TauE/SafE family protein [Armatimonadota bacterium]
MAPLVIASLIGLVAGVLSGMFGIGGGILVVPALVLLNKLDQAKAQGTSLAALLAPVGILGVIAYAQKQKVDWPIAACVAVGLVFGPMIGAKFVLNLDPVVIKRTFGAFVILVGVYFVFGK